MVGVDGIGGNIYFCFFVFFAFLRFPSLFLRIFLGHRQTTAIYWTNGEFHSDPVCTDPVQNFPMNTAAYHPAMTMTWRCMLLLIPQSNEACVVKPPAFCIAEMLKCCHDLLTDLHALVTWQYACKDLEWPPRQILAVCFTC